MIERAAGLVYDERWEYAGYHTRGGVCRVRLYRPARGRPVIVATELPENTNTSVTNMAGVLAAEVVRRLCPEALDARDDLAQPWVWVEHQLPLRWVRQDDEYSLVTFTPWRPRPYTAWVERRRVERWRCGQPRWTHAGREQVERLIGEAVR